MKQEMHQGEPGKVISKDKDGTQSRALVWGIGAILLLLSLDTAVWVLSFAKPVPHFVFEVVGTSLGFALVVFGLGAATPSGAACGGMICLLVSYWSGLRTLAVMRSGLMPLLLLFLLTFISTRAGKRKKTEAGLAEGRRGRSASQVIANLSVAGLSVSPLAGWLLVHGGVPVLFAGWMMKTICLAALIEATADTVSSEIGQAFGGQPVMITTLRRVAPGTDGGLTVLGSFAGVAAGIVVMLAGVWAMQLQTASAWIALGAGIGGLFFDSLLGATLERRGWLENDMVNFTSTVFAGLSAAAAYRFFVG